MFNNSYEQLDGGIFGIPGSLIIYVLPIVAIGILILLLYEKLNGKRIITEGDEINVLDSKIIKSFGSGGFKKAH